MRFTPYPAQRCLAIIGIYIRQRKYVLIIKQSAPI